MVEVKPAVIQFDIDGVLARNDKRIVTGVNRIFEHEGFPANKFTIQDIDSYYWADKVLKETFHYPDERIARITNQWYSGDCLAKNEPFPLAVAGLKFLNWLHHGQINFATSRDASSKDATYAWFEKYFPPAVKNGRIYMKDEFGLTGAELKRVILHLSGAQRHYEDDGTTAKKIGRGAVLLDKTYNRQPEFASLPRIYRDWIGILGHEIRQIKAR